VEGETGKYTIMEQSRANDRKNKRQISATKDAGWFISLAKKRRKHSTQPRKHTLNSGMIEL
jgi:hypothetical protein